jgi:hypothetical protein
LEFPSSARWATNATQKPSVNLGAVFSKEYVRGFG